MTSVAYLPINEPKPVAPDLWIVDSGPMHLAGMPIPLRMTVIRLGNGELVLHSPTQFSFELRARLETIGRIGHLVAPNTVHWSFMKEWQEHYPGVVSWGAPTLKERPAVQKADLKLDRVLEDGAPGEWNGEVEVVVVRGGAIAEAALFHRPSHSLVLTDLVVNVEPEKLPPLMKIGAKLVGSAAPDGKAPVYARAAFKAGGAAASAAAARLVALDPERVIFAHGRWFEQNGRQQLQQSLRWLLPA
ncbi:DUF4336 domain-containing protein [Devosia sp. 1566]|uniref:DUF4336 domain-containing protein n=1 Tax=Devosia sp. 1566 TaxID=2499144 RepID=UPI000FDC0D09|nr:DUF4336 domain-containing protein [Devosia sp. 1566]